VRGHEAQVAAIRRAVGRGRLAHAYLFTGPAGVGKRTFAVELARALLCEAKPAGASLDACGRCAACVQVDARTHPDFFVAARPDDAQEFPVELMRDVCKSFALKSARGRGKVVLLDDADELNDEAANCFLKTLEEPPPQSVLVLIGSSPDRQLPTIVSRCQVVRFHELPHQVVDELLRAKGIEDSALRSRLVCVSGGSLGRALELADPETWEFRRRLIKGFTDAAGPSPLLAGEWLSFVEGAGKEIPAQRRRARQVLRLLVDFLEDALAVSVGGPAPRSVPDDQPILEAFAARSGADALMGLLDRAIESDRQIERNVQLILVLEALSDAAAQRLGR
jgi:DNA polymerase-3 subunit delta'